MAVRFRLLGEVEARIDGRVVDLGHARQRCVLAALLVDVNRPVSTEQLLDRVWADRPPQRAHNTVSGYLSRLRVALAGTDEVRFERRAGTYLVTVDPAAVDLHLFHRLAAGARATTDAETAAALFEQALDLWHGEAFAALDTPWVNAVRAAADAERLAVLLDRNDLALRLGRHAALLGELAELSTAHPLDERLAGQLMLALYRCGRQAEALRHYQRLRAHLADELGADPSPPLRHLHQQLLTADAALPAAATSPVPRQLPAPPRAFTGRIRELAELEQVLADGPAAVVVSAVSGTAGVGKTAVALHWAHRVAGRFTDGQLYVNLRGFDHGGSVVDPASALSAFLDGLGVAANRIPTGLDARAALYRSLLSGRRILVLLDNARDVEQVRPLLPGSPGCLAIVTSRNLLTGLVAADGAHPLTLDLLTPADARDLLANRIGRARTADEPDAVDEIVTRCARLPLALTVVAARAATHPDFGLERIAAELRDAGGGLDALTDPDTATDVRAVFSWSYTALGADAARLFRLLGVHPGPDIAAPAAASLAGLPPKRVRPLLAELTRANLLTEHTPGRFTFHDLLRAYAAELAVTHDSEAERGAAVRRMLDHYLHTAHTAAMFLQPQRDALWLTAPAAGVTPEDVTGHGPALAWLSTELTVVFTAIELAYRTGFDAHTWQLASAVAPVSVAGGHGPGWAAAQLAALGAARRLGDRAGQAGAHRSLALVHARMAQYAEAHDHARRALDLFAELGDATGQAHTHLHLGWMSSQQGDDGDALVHAEEALRLYRVAGNLTGQANALNAVGWSRTRLGDHRFALTVCAEALGLLERTGDRNGQAHTWDSLGYAHLHLGHHDDAVSGYRRALDLHRDAGDRVGEAGTLGHLGDALDAAGDRGAALLAWRQATDLFDRLDHPDAAELRAKLSGAAVSS